MKSEGKFRHTVTFQAMMARHSWVDGEYAHDTSDPCVNLAAGGGRHNVTEA
jgi:hypothetical protein